MHYQNQIWPCSYSSVGNSFGDNFTDILTETKGGDLLQINEKTNILKVMEPDLSLYLAWLLSTSERWVLIPITQLFSSLPGFKMPGVTSVHVQFNLSYLGLNRVCSVVAKVFKNWFHLFSLCLSRNWKAVLDFKFLNRFMMYWWFKMETLKTITKALQQGEFMILTNSPVLWIFWEVRNGGGGLWHHVYCLKIWWSYTQILHLYLKWTCFFTGIIFTNFLTPAFTFTILSHTIFHIQNKRII